MVSVENITADNNQRHTLLKDNGDVVIVLRFHATIQQWTIDVERNDKAVYGVKLAVGVRHIESTNMGVDFIVQDTSGNGIDPFRIDDFESGRCLLAMIDAV